ncbi:chemotaxis protein [Brevundimonas sp. LM2]|uniref:CheR family methyltransferase n=1 Tax=Brevundimonas sp. LM2 TaxID=1938605 RepID=UPI00098399B2|nr:protein-glutamate O-methyltransferase [Brevundimonas sp. LM2]AQR63107.1 chemotaxis protein [Brevundimonas sp. LM2]
MIAGARNHKDDVAVPGEFFFTWGDFADVAALLYQMSGIHLTETKANLVYSRLAKRLRALGLKDFSTYIDGVKDPREKEERSAFLSSLTTNLTRFFREPHHFTHLGDAKMPGLVRRARAGDRVRLWSAGCSAGHEPYSMAMTVLEALPDAGRLDVRILGSDIDPLIVQRAATGVYSTEDVEPIPDTLRRKYLHRQGDDYSLSEDVRSLVSFRCLNLLGDWPMKNRFDIIFCRNVAIYFDGPTQDRLFRRFSDTLEDDGHLYIGHSERAQTEGLVADALTAYRREARNG